MKKTLRPGFISLGIAISVFSGCAANSQVDRRSPSEVFLDAVFGFFEETDYERYERQNSEQLAKRRKWQSENLSASELSELGIGK